MIFRRIKNESYLTKYKISPVLLGLSSLAHIILFYLYIKLNLNRFSFHVVSILFNQFKNKCFFKFYYFTEPSLENCHCHLSSNFITIYNSARIERKAGRQSTPFIFYKYSSVPFQIDLTLCSTIGKSERLQLFSHHLQ